MDTNLDGRVALVTGAGRGIGRAYAQALADDGASIVVADIDGGLAEAAAKELAAEGHESLAVTVDVSSKDETLDMAEKVRDRFGSADILVNNAAIFHSIRQDSQMTVDIEYWRKVFAVNVEGVLLCTQAIAPMMIEKEWGRIVNQASTSVYMGTGGHYCCSKAALVPMTRRFAHELGPHGITVNAIAPGFTDTEASRSVMPEGRVQFWIDQSALKRTAEPQDIVGTLRFLASDLSAWVTGQTLIVDAGVCSRL